MLVNNNETKKHPISWVNENWNELTIYTLLLLKIVQLLLPFQQSYYWSLNSLAALNKITPWNKVDVSKFHTLCMTVSEV